MKIWKRQGTDFIGLRKMFSARIIFAFAFALAIGWTGVPEAAAQTAVEANSPRAEQVFKNIQVFKGLPADQLLPMMQFIAGSLGVHCGLCHHQDEAKRDDDGKAPKLLARKMVQMVNDINKNAFGGRKVVSCYTCHRGSTFPVRPSIFDPDAHSAAVEGRDEAPPAASAIPTPDQILDKYLAALGGADAVSKITSVVQKGTITEAEPGQKATTSPIEIFAKVPGKYRAVTHVKSGDATAIYNGNSGWFLFAGTRTYISAERIWDLPIPYEPVRAMRGDELDAVQLGDPLFLGTRLKQLVTGLRTTGMEKIGTQDTYVVSGRSPNLPMVKLYFGKESGLLARLAYDVETPLGPIPHQVDYADYRNVNGIKVAFEWKATDIREPSYVFKMSEVQSGASVDESLFAKPAPVSR